MVGFDGDERAPRARAYKYLTMFHVPGGSHFTFFFRFVLYTTSTSAIW